MANKGSPFEREIAKILSEWWTNGARSDVFWRTTTSGARATTRGKKGLATVGSYGDLTTLDPTGKPLLDLFTFELKRGYSRYSVADLLDAAPRAKEQTHAGWFAKAALDQTAAGSYAWMVIARRDQRQAVCFFPYSVAEDWLAGGRVCGGALQQLVPSLNLVYRGGMIYGCLLTDFLEVVSPEDVVALLRRSAAWTKSP